MKRYRATGELFAEIDRVLRRNRPSFKCSPLDTVIDLLCRGRHYSWMGIYLSAEGESDPHPLGSGGDDDPGQLTLSGTRRKILIAMKLPSREVGVLSAESPRENAFGAQDRVLLEKVAARLARFLTGPGKYIVRRARGTASLAGPGKINPEAKK